MPCSGSSCVTGCMIARRYVCWALGNGEELGGFFLWGVMVRTALRPSRYFYNPHDFYQDPPPLFDVLSKDPYVTFFASLLVESFLVCIRHTCVCPYNRSGFFVLTQRLPWPPFIGKEWPLRIYTICLLSLCLLFILTHPDLTGTLIVSMGHEFFKGSISPFTFSLPMSLEPGSGARLYVCVCPPSFVMGVELRFVIRVPRNISSPSWSGEERSGVYMSIALSSLCILWLVSLCLLLGQCLARRDFCEKNHTP